MCTWRHIHLGAWIFLLWMPLLSGINCCGDWMAQDVRAEYEERMKPLRNSLPTGRLIKIRDLVDVAGSEEVKLTGFGVVTGLQGTGDSSKAALKMLLTVAEKQGIRLNPSEIKSKNVALVSISAEVSPHDRIFDIAVKSIGDCKSLQNGFLEGSTLCPLGSEEVFAVASGAVALGARFYEAQSQASGGTASLSSGSSVTIGHPTTGFVIDGGQLICDIPCNPVRDGQILLCIKHPSERTATNIADSINEYMLGLGIEAIPMDACTVAVRLEDPVYVCRPSLIRLIADIGDLPTKVSRKAMITVDQGSGVIAMTEGVKMEPGSIAVAGLTVTVSSNITPVTRQAQTVNTGTYFGDNEIIGDENQVDISQRNSRHKEGLGGGETAFFDVPDLQVSQSNANFLMLPAGTDLRQVQESLNALRLTPTSIISVFNAMHKAGMIHADIVVIPR